MSVLVRYCIQHIVYQLKNMHIYIPMYTWLSMRQTAEQPNDLCTTFAYRPGIVNHVCLFYFPLLLLFWMCGFILCWHFDVLLLYTVINFYHSVTGTGALLFTHTRTHTHTHTHTHTYIYIYIYKSQCAPTQDTDILQWHIHMDTHLHPHPRTHTHTHTHTILRRPKLNENFISRN